MSSSARPSAPKQLKNNKEKRPKGKKRHSPQPQDQAAEDSEADLSKALANLEFRSGDSNVNLQDSMNNLAQTINDAQDEADQYDRDEGDGKTDALKSLYASQSSLMRIVVDRFCDDGVPSSDIEELRDTIQPGVHTTEQFVDAFENFKAFVAVVHQSGDEPLKEKLNGVLISLADQTRGFMSDYREGASLNGSNVPE